MTTTTMQEYLAHKHGREDDDFFERRIGEYHSSQSNKCLRRLYLDFTVGSTPGEDAWPHFQLGNILEDEYMSALRHKYGWRNVKNSIPIEIEIGDFKIVGETDPVVVDPNMNISQLFEIKTTAGLGYVKEEPKPDHVYQVHPYMKALGQTDAIIVYIGKKDLETVEHVVEFDDEIWNEIVMKFTRLHRALKIEEMPPISTNEDDQDYFCPFDGTDDCCKNQ